MGYRLSIDAISCDYHEDKNDSRLSYHNKQLYYGTKLYGYTLDLEESLSYNFLLALGKFDDYDTYFGYSASNEIILNYKQLCFFLKLYSLDLDKDRKEYNENYSEDYKEGWFLEDKDILNIFNKPFEFEDENFLVYWC